MPRLMLVGLLLFCSATTAWGQRTQLGSAGNRNGARVAQVFDEPLVGEPIIADQGPVYGDGGLMGNGYIGNGRFGDSIWNGQGMGGGGLLGGFFGLQPGQDCQGDGGGLIAGGGVYYLKPHWDNNPAFFESHLYPAGSALQGLQRNLTTEFNYDYHFAPHAFVGYLGPNGFGARGRWFMYEQSTGTLNATIPGPGPFGIDIGAAQTPASLGNLLFLAPNLTANAGDRLSVTSSLRLYMYDLEGVQVIDHQQWKWTFSGGVRYGILKQAYLAENRRTVGGANTLIGVQQSSQRFEGIGPTLALEGQRQIGQSGLAFYGIGRFSVLFGDSEQTAEVSVPAVPAIPQAFAPFSATVSQWEVLPIAEIEAGVEFNVFLGTAKFFVRSGLVGQVYWGAGNAAGVGLTGQADDNTDLGLYGMRISAGLDY